MVEAVNDPRFDIDLTARDIQELAGADALAALFAKLGYRTNSRTVQTPGNLGITAEGTLKPIKRIELLADQEGLFQVYLFELSSVTVAHTRLLARAFRNRAGNFLLVLTSDYERLDFVLLERFLPPSPESGTIGEKQVGIRPRTLTVERRKPSRRELRVIRRLTWTEPDGFAQHEKLLAAYSVADWSEEHFNNRALFSDYYLLERLREFAEWAEDPKPAYLALRECYIGAAARFAGKPLTELKSVLVEPVLAALGFEFERGKPLAAHDIPDYRLLAPGGKVQLGLLLVYPWARALDGKDDQRDSEKPDENPGARVVSILEKSEVPWVVVTNGRLWRLYAHQTHSRATNYYELDAEELLADTGVPVADPGEAFRYFWLLFRRQAFEKRSTQRDGKPVELSLLDRLLLESEDYAKELGSRLKERVFEQVFPHLGHGFVEYVREHGSVRAVPQETLDEIFQGTLTLLYRLLFLLYAESRDLLPVREVRGYWEASLKRLKEEVAGHAGPIEDEVEAKLKKAYRNDSFVLWERFEALFAIVDRGDAALNVPFYNGGLFLTNPDKDDDTPEARAARFLASHRIGDRDLAQAIDLLSRSEDAKSHALVPIDYKSLGVRQLGSIYEGLLEFKLKISDEKLAVTKEKGREVYVPFADLDQKAQERAERTGRVVKKSAVYIENDKRERKASGSYYTPDYIVGYIVEHAVGPVLDEKFEQMRPKLRAAQAERKAFFDKQKALEQRGIRPDLASKADRIGEKAVDELFDIKVLDPAMGSGHFLVEAVDFITDRMLTFLNAFPWNPVEAHLKRTRDTILAEAEVQEVTLDPAKLTDVNLLKRHVLKRCIYGVDLNPMAVELAKVSLWLDCFTLGAPLSFLDHHLRWGNSLVGITEKQFEEAQKRGGQLSLLEGSQYTGAKMAVGAMIAIGALPDITPEQTRESRRQYSIAAEALAPVKRLFDVYASQWFGNEPRTVGKGKKRAEHNPALDFLADSSSEVWAQKLTTVKLPELFKKVADTALQASAKYRFFHWELEFPEVFFGTRVGTTQIIERMEGAGFEAVVGNPPYDELSEDALGRTIPERSYIVQSPSYQPVNDSGGRLNWYHLFILRGIELGRDAGYISYVVPMAWLGDSFASGVRATVLAAHRPLIIDCFPQKDDPNDRVFREAKLSTSIFVCKKGRTTGSICVRTHPGKDVTDTEYFDATIEVLAWLNPAQPTIPVIKAKGWHILKKVATAKNLGTVGDCAGIPTSGEIIFNEDTRRFMTDDPSYDLILRGGHIQRYELLESARQGDPIYLRTTEYLAASRPGSKAFDHRSPRIVYQEGSAIDAWRRVVPTHLPSGYICGHKVCYFTAYKIDPLTLLAVFASTLLNWLVEALSTTNSLPGYLVGSLPFPNFGSQSTLIGSGIQNELCKIVESVVVSKADFDQVLMLVDASWTPVPSKPEVLSAILANLASRMLDLHKRKQLAQREFLDWLKRNLQIEPPSNEESGLDGLQGKTRLLNYLGDYQKNEPELGEDELLEFLVKNRGRIRAPVTDAGFQTRVKGEFAKSLSVLRPIKHQLARTDRLIDLIVYRLYGLTDEEIAIVEDRDQDAPNTSGTL